MADEKLNTKQTALIWPINIRVLANLLIKLHVIANAIAMVIAQLIGELEWANRGEPIRERLTPQKEGVEKVSCYLFLQE